MAVSVVWTIDQATLDFILRSPSGPVVQALAQIAQEITNLAKQLAPVDTGRLRASIAWTIGEADGTPFARIGTNVEYAPFQEFGTRFHPAQPFLVPALLRVLGAG